MPNSAPRSLPRRRGARVRSSRLLPPRPPHPAVLAVLAVLLTAACTDASDPPPPQPTGGSSPAASSPDPRPAAVVDATSAGLGTRWGWPVPAPGSAGVPAADERGVVLVHRREVVVALDPGGDVLWEASVTGARDVAPLLTDELVVVPTEEGLVALGRLDGAEAWRADLGDRTNTPAVAGGVVVATTWDGVVAGMAAGDGRPLWQSRLPGGTFAGPGGSGTGGGAVAVTWDTGVEAGLVLLDAATGASRWDRPLDADGVSPPAMAGGLVVVVAGDIEAHAFAAADGSPRWSTALEGSGAAEVAPLPRGAEVLVPHRLGGMALLELSTGEPVWTASSESAVVDGGVTGPGPAGSFALGLVDGSVLLADGTGTRLLTAAAPLRGVAGLPDGTLVVTTAKGEANAVVGLTGW